MSERKIRSPAANCDLFHVIHKVPAGDSPYVRAKQVQLIEKDPSRAISLFWSAINAGDRVDSALKDMAVVMKQLNRADEAIEAIRSFRHLCPYDSQESIDNVLVELYKRAGRTEEEIEMLQSKLKHIDEVLAFGGRKTKTARSQGKKVHITIEQEKSRILGNLAWAYLQQNNYKIAEEHYRKALLLEPDENKQCNLAICLMHTNRLKEAKSLLQAVKASTGNKPMDESYVKSYERAHQMLTEIEQQSLLKPIGKYEDGRKGVSRSLVFPSNRNLKEDNTFINGGPRRWEDGREETLQVVTGQHTECHCAHHYESKENVHGQENKNLRWLSSRVGSTSKYSQPSMSVSKWKQHRYEDSDESRSQFLVMKQNWVDTVETEASPLFRNLESSFPAFPSEDSRRRLCGDIAHGKGDAVAQPVSPPGSWRNGGYPQIKGRLETASELVLNGNWRKSCSTWENSDVKKSSGRHTNLKVNFTVEPAKLVDDTTALEASNYGESDQINCSVDNSPCKADNNHYQVTEDSHPTQDSSLSSKRKSWADMVEEEEGLLTGPEYLDGWTSEEEFNDENLNSNIIGESPRLQTQMKI
ncbi:hypothetical protein FNV43_RR06570 [Rhamnella rubrinervis]|nr:hypothetical protein FNV43_RR06570 [Rhamnella rubrinervis]